MRKSKGSLEVALQYLGEMVSGASFRAAANLKHLGEVVQARIGDGNDAGIDVDENKKDVWISWTDVLSGMRDVGRLLAPAGILWRAPAKDEGAHVVRGRKMRGPGASLVMPDGGDGSTSVVPDWFPDHSGLSEYADGKDLHLEAKKGAVKLDSDTGDNKTVQLNGTDSKAILDSLLSDLSDAITILYGAAVAPPGGGAVTYTDPMGKVSALLLKLGDGTYQSKKVELG